MSSRKRTDDTPDTPSAPDAPAAVQSVREAVVAAAARADWLTPADQGALTLALKLAADIDKLNADEAAALASLARTFLTTLDRLGLTVTSRTSTPAAPQEDDPLAQLRLRAEARLTGPTDRDTATVRALPRR